MNRFKIDSSAINKNFEKFSKKNILKFRFSENIKDVKWSQLQKLMTIIRVNFAITSHGEFHEKKIMSGLGFLPSLSGRDRPPEPEQGPFLLAEVTMRTISPGNPDSTLVRSNFMPKK